MMRQRLSIVLATVMLMVWFGQTRAETVVTSARQLQAPFDPQGNYSLDDVPLHAVYETLVTVGPQGEIRPGLAVSWTASPDHRTFTFKLRDGVTFHDGSPLTAEAVKWTFLRMLKLNVVPYGYFRKAGDENG